MSLDHLDPVSQKFGDLKKERWWRRKIEKLQYICFADRPVFRKFGMVMCLVSPNRVSI